MASHNPDLLDRCREAVSLAHHAGADVAEVFGQTVDSINSTVEKNDLQISKSQFETAFGIRVFVGGRAGFASTNNAERIQSACRNAVTLAKASPEDPHNVLPETDPTPAIDGLYDSGAEAFGTADAVCRTVDMLSLTEKIDRRVILNDAWFDADVREVAIANSAGLAVRERGSLFTYGVIATAREGERVSSFDFQFGATRTVAGIDVDTPIRRVCENTLASLGAERGESFRGPVVLSPNAVSEILIGTLLFQLNARDSLRGRTRWKGMLGSPVAVPALTLVDDGRLPGGVATASFDREGVPHKQLTLIRDGVLTSLLQNTYTAHATGSENTGHAAGSARSIPSIGPTNLSVLPGDASVDNLLSGMQRGLLIRRFSGNVDPISGDFSGSVKAAHLVERGRPTHAVSGTLIAGNVFDALETLSGISERREQVYNLTLPYVRLENVSVTAN